MNVYEGKLIPGKIKVGIVAARFNEFITSRLLSGALDGLRRHEVGDEDIDIAWVPGAFEIPLAASKMASSSRYDAVICLGAVIRGSTSHYDYVCSEVSKGIAHVSLTSGIPVMFGVLTTETIEQAIERAGSKAGNKGYECAVGAIEMAGVPALIIPAADTTQAAASANTNESHTPSIPHMPGSRNARGMMARHPLTMDMQNAFPVSTTALKKAALTILTPAKRNPAKYSWIPRRAMGTRSWLPSLLNMAMIPCQHVLAPA